MLEMSAIVVESVIAFKIGSLYWSTVIALFEEVFPSLIAPFLQARLSGAVKTWVAAVLLAAMIAAAGPDAAMGVRGLLSSIKGGDNGPKRWLLISNLFAAQH
jgi:hypothetical protein